MAPSDTNTDSNGAVTATQVLDALRPIEDPDLHKSIVDLDFVKKIRICGGNVGDLPQRRAATTVGHAGGPWQGTWAATAGRQGRRAPGGGAT